MNLPKEKKLARFMMHLSVIIGAWCFIVFVMSVAMKIWLSAIAMAMCGVAQYFIYKSWQKKA